MALERLMTGRFRFSVTVLLAVCSLTGFAAAQQAIRVETKQVLVPVIVIDKERYDHFLMNVDSLYHPVLPGEADAIASALLVHGLTVADFQLLDDGKQQTIQSVTEEQSLLWDVRDNIGYHTEYMGPGGGKWSTRQWPPTVPGDVDAPQYYILAYVPPESSKGSCHQIKIIVNRPNAWVRVRPEYCNNANSPWDVLSGTGLDKQMEGFQTLQKKRTVDVSLMAISFHRKSGIARVHMIVEWPWQQFKQGNKSKINGLLGIVFDKQGKMAARFSDLTEREGGVALSKHDKGWHGLSDIIGAEDRYERQLDLPPGDYKLRVILGDGERFGQTEIPLTIDSYDGKDLALSQISLCKQIDDFSSYGHESVLPGAWTAKLPDSYTPLISNGMQFKPTPNSRFKKGDSLYTYFEVYDPQLGTAETPAAIQIELRVVNAMTGAALSAPESINTAQYIKPKDPVVPIGRGIDISKLPSGSYRLEIRATDSTGKTTPWKKATFTVE